jgi:hypothetical protein
VENKSFFDDPLRREGANGYDEMKPQITQITRIFVDFRFGNLNRKREGRE